jgi:hypothetical protein
MDDEFSKPPAEREFIGVKTGPIGALNVALLFCTAIIALTLIVTPLLTKDDDKIEASTMGYDDIKTGSIPTHDGKVKRYTIRRSVLQSNPGDVCIINENGDKTGC